MMLLSLAVGHMLSFTGSYKEVVVVVFAASAE